MKGCVDEGCGVEGEGIKACVDASGVITPDAWRRQRAPHYALEGKGRFINS